MVGNIRCKVRQQTSILFQYSVFIITELRRLEPKGIIFLICQTFIRKILYDLLDAGTVILIEIALMDPAVKVHAEEIQIPADRIQFHFNAFVLEVFHPYRRILMEPLIAILILDDLCYFHNILRMIAILRQRIFYPE